MENYSDKIVDWRDVYSVSIPHIDEHHKRLFLILNKTYAADLHKDFQAIQESIEELKDYADVHFKAEETFLESKNVDHKHIHDHCMEHKSFINMIAEFEKNLNEDGFTEVSRNMVIFLVDWLATHIMVKDKAMDDLVKN